MKKKKIFVFFFVLITGFSIFAEEQNAHDKYRLAKDALAYENAKEIGSTWVNAPLFKMLTQFCNMEEKWIIVARDIAVVMVILNLIWQCIQIAFGTMEVRKAIVSSLTKWFLFLFIMCLYPAINVGLLKASQEIAESMVGNWQKEIGSNLVDYYKTLIDEVQKKGNETASLVAMKQAQLNRLIASKTTMKEWYDNNDNTYEEDVKQLQNELQTLKNYHTGDVSVQTYRILREIFSVKTDDVENQHVTAWNIMLNTIFTKTYISPDLVTKANGKTTFGKSSKKRANIHIMSPDAIMKSIYLACCVMWEREWTSINQEWDMKQEATQADPNTTYLSKTIMKKMTILEFPFHRVIEIIYCLILICAMVFCGSVSLIQYIMCLLEYTIISGAAAIMIPFMLFDGLNDMAQRVISTLIQQSLKMIFCIIICTFSIWCFFYLTEQFVAAVTGVSLQNFVFGIFMSVLGGALMTNAPKLASVLTTGTPQMSMGEVAQMAASYAAGGHIASKAAGRTAHLVTTASKLGKEGIRAGAKGIIGAAGQHSRNSGARQGAFQAAKEAGYTDRQAKGYAFKAGLEQWGSDIGRTAKRGAFNFVTGSGGSGKGGGGKSGGTGAQNSLNLNSDKWTNSNDAKNLQTAEAHNYNYGQSMHYEYDKDNNQFISTSPKNLKEHLNTQKEDAKQAAMEKYAAGLKKIKEEKNK